MLKSSFQARALFLLSFSRKTNFAMRFTSFPNWAIASVFNRFLHFGAKQVFLGNKCLLAFETSDSSIFLSISNSAKHYFLPPVHHPMRDHKPRYLLFRLHSATIQALPLLIVFFPFHQSRNPYLHQHSRNENVQVELPYTCVGVQ